jgi:site-specific recombinase XerC
VAVENRNIHPSSAQVDRFLLYLIVVVSKFLGHARLSTTEQYTHISSAQMFQAYNAAHPHAGKETQKPKEEEHHAN